jgi:hypothetical protein
MNGCFLCFAKQGFPLTIVVDPQYWLGGTFGGIRAETLTESLVDELIQLARMQGKQLALLSAGRQGGGGATWRILSNRYAGTVPFVALGILPGEKISGFLNSLDFGIAATPWILLGKSRSVAAMKEYWGNGRCLYYRS